MMMMTVNALAFGSVCVSATVLSVRLCLHKLQMNVFVIINIVTAVKMKQSTSF